MRTLVTCLAFASHIGIPAAFHSYGRNFVSDEASVRSLLDPSKQNAGICATDFWDCRGTALAKINLSLQVEPESDVKQPLLSLVTLMQKVLWGDHISVKRLDNAEATILSKHFDTTSDGNVLLMIDETQDDQAFKTPVSFPFDDSNIISRALKMVTKDDQKYLVLTRKRVLPGSGLGGGSADAAFILKNLGDDIKPREYLSLGSDVSFLASNENVAVISGMGEQITPLEDLAYKSHVYILIPDEHVSTKGVFNKTRECLSQGIFDPGPTPISVSATSKSAANFSEFQPFNTLEQCVTKHNVQHLLEILRKHVPSKRCGMSGSGCSCFLLDVDDAEALRIRQLYGKPLVIVKTRFKQAGDGKADFKYL
ncbi:4-diphosphocytidyl-2-C-methyl-D-erythritol kinase, related [Babesia divergens]|uniref:4-diphosphocytidyl-2-C-methyl-D-erythritol kinase, related n=1 Tax=Babesia divergens TaxID=32595 RepID=A0AAD9LI36_BABDI|nr:4-diphosphocytidyl-2-C-methyl-D-erythritol kinase, related [Babesia divergens]